MKFHYRHQNLDERPGDGSFRPTGFLWKHGRAWLAVGNWLRMRWSWNLWGSFCALQVSCSSEDGLALFVALPPVAFWFSVDLAPLRRWYARHDWKHIGVRVFDGALWVDLWSDDSCWSPYRPFWHPHRRRFSIRPLDILLGRVKHATEREIATEPIVVCMPEADYRGTVRLEVETWRRPRWPWWPSAVRIVRARIDMQDPIPFPGKGENSWDCGEDATSGLTCKASSVPEAIAAMTETVLSSRRRNGGPNWRPEKYREARA